MQRFCQNVQEIERKREREMKETEMQNQTKGEILWRMIGYHNVK